MKTSLWLGSILFFSLLSSCTPKDAPVISGAQREQINEKAKNRSGGGGRGAMNSSEFYPGSYAFSVFLLQKNIEAVELVTLALGSEDVTKSLYELKTGELKDSVQQLSLEQNNKVHSYRSVDGEIKAKLNKILNVKVRGDEAANWVEIKGQSLKASHDLIGKKKFFVNLFEDSYSLTLQRDPENSEVLILTLSSKARLEGAKGGRIAKLPVTIDLSLEMDAKSLETSEVRIISLSSQMTYPNKQATKTFGMQLKGSDLTLKPEGLCPIMKGSVDVKTDPKKPSLKLEIDANQVVVADKWKKNLPACGSRPAVDLSILGVY